MRGPPKLSKVAGIGRTPVANVNDAKSARRRVSLQSEPISERPLVYSVADQGKYIAI